MDKKGFLVKENFISHADCDALLSHSRFIINHHAPLYAPLIFKSRSQGISQEMHYLSHPSDLCLFFHEDAFLPDGSLGIAPIDAVKKISPSLHRFDSVFSTFSEQEKIKELMIELGYQDPLLVQSMLIFKHPKRGEEVFCHQDGTFLYTEPDTTVGLWIALEDATIDNGCLWVIPDGHVTPLKYRFVLDEEKLPKFITLHDTPWELKKMIPLEVPKGSLIVLHGRLPHMSLANHSPFSRPAYTLHLIDGSSKYCSKNWLKGPFKRLFHHGCEDTRGSSL